MAEKPTKRQVPAARAVGVSKAIKSKPKRADDVVGSKGPAASRAKGLASPSGRATIPGSSTRYTPPDRDIQHRPSPIYVPIAMFSLLGAGMLLIVANYINVFGEAENIRLILGLGLILAGIMVATQYR